MKAWSSPLGQQGRFRRMEGQTRLTSVLKWASSQPGTNGGARPERLRAYFSQEGLQRPGESIRRKTLVDPFRTIEVISLPHQPEPRTMNPTLFWKPLLSRLLQAWRDQQLSATLAQLIWSLPR